MRIKARVRTTCPMCGRPIFVGSVVEWQPNTRARHIDCTVKAETGRRLYRFRKHPR
jgi:hypothetical protein